MPPPRGPVLDPTNAATKSLDAFPAFFRRLTPFAASEGVRRRKNAPAHATLRIVQAAVAGFAAVAVGFRGLRVNRATSPLRNIASITRASQCAVATRAIFLRPGSPR